MGKNDKQKKALAKQKLEAENKRPTLEKALGKVEANDPPTFHEACETAEWLYDDVSDDEEEHYYRFAKGHQIFHILLAKSNNGGLADFPEYLSACTAAFKLPTDNNVIPASSDRRDAAWMMSCAMNFLPLDQRNTGFRDSSNDEQEKRFTPGEDLQTEDGGAQDMESEDDDAEMSEWEGSVSGELGDLADLNVDSDMELDDES